MDPVSFLIQFAISYLIARLQQPNGPRLTDTAQGIGDYGAALAILLGEKIRVVTNPIAAQIPFKETVHKHKPVLDYMFGIVGALLPAVKTYTYSTTLGLHVADRTNDLPIEDVEKLYGGGKVLFNSAESTVVAETLDADGYLVMRKYGPNRFCSSVTVYGGGFDQVADPSLDRDIGNQPGYRGSAYVVIENLQLSKDFGNGVPAPIEALVRVRTGETVAGAVEKICAAAGIDAEHDLSSTELTNDTLRGYAVTSAGAKCWDAVKPLLTGFGADCGEVGGQVRFYKRNRALRATLEPNDLGAYVYGDSSPSRYTVRREPDVGLPRETSLTFLDPARDYATNTQGARRSEGDADSNLNVNIPLVMTADEGASAAEMMLWDTWLGRRTLQFTTTDTHIGLEVGRAYALPIAGEYLAYRITRRTRGLNGIIEVEAQSDEDVTYSASISGSSGVIVPPNSTLVPETRLVAIDGPILNDGDDEYGFYVAVGGGDSSWTSGEVQASADGGTTYFDLLETGDSALVGDVAGALAAGPTTGLDDTLDTTTVLTVDLLHDGMTLEDATDAQLDAFANLSFVGKDGLGELMQFKTATHITGSTWELTNLRRGRKGTDWAIAGHASGEEFALLTDGAAIRLPATTTDSWGVPLKLRGVTFNQDEADADIIDFTNTGEGKRPYSPVEVMGSWDGSNNLTISWTNRSRLNAGGLGIDDQANYEVEITTGAGTTLTATGATNVVYSAADQTTDGITPGDSITGRVRQLSDVNDGRWRDFFLSGPGAALLHMEDDTTPLHLEDGVTPFELG